MNNNNTILRFVSECHQKNMSNGMCNISHAPLSDDEIKQVLAEIERIQADKEKFIFNDDSHMMKSTCYNYNDIFREMFFQI